MNRKLGLPAIDDEYFEDADYVPDKSWRSESDKSLTITQLLEGWKKAKIQCLQIGSDGEI